jgi:fibronectin-binding autotransporter adhesin
MAVNSDGNLGTGPLSFNGGTLEALAAGSGITSSKASTLNAGGGTFLADTGTSSILSGIISGVGSLTMNGTGTLTLTGANTYSGGTNLNGGILAVNNDANLGTAALSFNGGTLEALAAGGGITSSKTVTLNAGGGTFLADTGTSSTLSGNISGIGSLTKNGLGTLTLSGNNTYSGATNVAFGTLRAGSSTAFSANSAFNVASVLDLNGFNNTIGSLSGNGTVTNSGAATAILTVGNGNSNTTFAGILEGGTGVLGLTKTGTGTFILTGNDTYSGGTTISAGTLQLGNGGTSGSILGNVVNNGVFAIDRSDTYTFAGSSSGTGVFQQLGTGTTVLTGTNTYTGGTTISAGTLQIGNGGTTGSITGNVTDNATLVFDRSDLVTYSGVISGTGALVQSGSGTLTLTGGLARSRKPPRRPQPNCPC